jgi:hypothetical protein
MSDGEKKKTMDNQWSIVSNLPAGRQVSDHW